MTPFQKMFKKSWDRVHAVLKPPPELSLSQWADKFAYLSAESSAEPGQWRCIPYQIGIMDAFTDPRVERVTVMKSARVGYTKILNHIILVFLSMLVCFSLVVGTSIVSHELLYL